jgi:hypothetical protein
MAIECHSNTIEYLLNAGPTGMKRSFKKGRVTVSGLPVQGSCLKAGIGYIRATRIT